VDYSLFMAMMMVLTSERAEKLPGATPIVFPPSIFAGTASISVFHVSMLPPLGNAKGGLYIDFF
jgi:hypothetical protein